MNLVMETEDGVEPIGEATPDTPTVAVIPGDDVALHRLLLAETDPAARAAEARMRATDLSAQPIDEVHVAVGPADPEGASWVALIDRQRLEGHLAHLKAAGAEPAHLLPAALLLEPAGAQPSMARFGDRILIRTDAVAGLVEPSLASALTGSSQLGRFLQLNAFAPAGPPERLEIDLLQGAFAPRRRWWRERRFRILLGVLAALVIALLLAPFAIERARAAAVVATTDRAVVELAAGALGTRPADAEAGAKALADARRAAEGGGIAARLGFVSAGIQGVPGVRIARADLAPGTGLVVRLEGPADAVRTAGQRLQQGAFAVAAGADGALTIGDRVAARATEDSAQARAMLRLVTARQDAALLAAAKARPALKPDQVTALLAAAGLQPVVEPASGRILVPAARATVLLPTLADLELKGARLAAAEIRPNADQTLAARLAVAP